MELKDNARNSINPRYIARALGHEGLKRMLLSVGYTPKPDLLSDICLSLRHCWPMLLGGPRGSGKTALPEALAESCNLNHYYVPGVEGLTSKEVLGGWNTAAQDQYVRQVMMSHTGDATASKQLLKSSRTETWSEEFYERGEFLEAFDYARWASENNEPPPILTIDEVEKLPVKIQNLFLQPLARGWANVPKLEGRIGVSNPDQMPIIFLTSNDLSLLSDPLKSRCLPTWVELAKAMEEVEILFGRVPEAPSFLVAATVKITAHIKEDMPGVRDKPGLRESIGLLKALVTDHVERITEETIIEYLPFLAKGPKERNSIRSAADRIVEAVSIIDEIDIYATEVREITLRQKEEIESEVIISLPGNESDLFTAQLVKSSNLNEVETPALKETDASIFIEESLSIKDEAQETVN